MRVLITGAVAFALLLATPAGEALAQSAKSKEGQTAAQKPAVPDAYKIDMLIRTTLIALSQANLTGNYTVLRDLGSPSFQATNSAARLAEAFTDLRQRKLDFAPILFFNPKLVRQPAVDDAGRLRFTGFLDTKPERINFDMMFEHVGGDWRLFGLAVQMQPAPAPTAAAGQKEAPAAKQPAAKQKAATKTSAPAKK
jgi:hypothetical protein